MKQCPRCGSKYDDFASFCNKCEIDLPSSQKMRVDNGTEAARPDYRVATGKKVIIAGLTVSVIGGAMYFVGAQTYQDCVMSSMNRGFSSFSNSSGTLSLGGALDCSGAGLAQFGFYAFVIGLLILLGGILKSFYDRKHTFEQAVGKQINVTAGGNVEQNVVESGSTVIGGDQFSGNFSGAVVNVNSRFENVNQTISRSSVVKESEKDQLKSYIQELETILKDIPSENSSEMEAIAKTTEMLVDEATSSEPNNTLLNISAKGLKEAAESVASIVPTIMPVVQGIIKILL